MAQIKQTAYQSTGGKVPCKQLAIKANISRVQSTLKKTRHFSPGTVALCDTRCYQKSINLLFPKLPF